MMDEGRLYVVEEQISGRLQEQDGEVDGLFVGLDAGSNGCDEDGRRLISSAVGWLTSCRKSSRPSSTTSLTTPYIGSQLSRASGIGSTWLMTTCR